MRDVNNIDYAIDTLTNRYDSVGGNNLTYDAAGNLTKDKNGYTYHYDYENRLIKIKKSNDTVTVAEFSYDALGRRVKKTDSITSANTKCYYYNYNWQILSEFDGSGGYKKSYIYGNYIDEVLMSVVSAIATTHKYYLHDHLSSPVALTDNDGVVVERYEYDAYGKCYVLEPNFAPDPDGKPDVGNPFMFTGRELDILDNGNLKIQYNRNRYYDYYTGRWLTHDPFGITPGEHNQNEFAPVREYINGLSLYEYVKSTPTEGTDPLGLIWPPGEDPDELARSFLEYDLSKVCDKFSCEQCCEVGVRYTEEDKAKCKVEAKEFAREYERGIREYWRIGRDYTECYEYQQYIMGEDSKYPWDFAKRWKYFTLAKGNRITLWYFHSNFVGVFHVCNKRKVIYGKTPVWELPKRSDATLYPWAPGWPWWPHPYNRGIGKPYVLEGWESDVPWNSWIRHRP
jgi:RHS repeat-associated protein